MSITRDVIVVGGGNAALCAAISASEAGARVTLVERAPEAERGGNSRFTAGAFRFAYNGVDDLLEVMPDLSADEIERTEFGAYTSDDFYDDMGRVTEYRSDPELTELLITRSLETMVWLQRTGLRFVPMYGRQAYKIDDKFRFWGGLTVEAAGGGPGLVQQLYDVAERRQVEVLYGHRVTSLLYDGRSIEGVCIRSVKGERREIRAPAVVLACGGFEANAEWRTRYLGPGWDLAKVRGTKFNTGDGIRMALDIGAMSYGNWSGCHAVGWDMNAPTFGDLAVGDGFQKHSYPVGIMVNAEGQRFVDEGADFRNYTYAKYGRKILEQPGQHCWQVFDAKVQHLLRDEYSIQKVSKVSANSLEELSNKLEGVDGEAFLATVREYNAAVRQDIPFDPTVKDGRGTVGLAVPKSNWANTLDKPPFEAYWVTCGITFTFGGLRINGEGRVLDDSEAVMDGLFAAGELVGGLFYFNYPGGTGLLSGSLFGRIAGHSAALYARNLAQTGDAMEVGALQK